MPETLSDIGVHTRSCEVCTVGDLARNAVLQEAREESYVGCNSGILCLMFTGGTSRTKIVQVTHAMVLHERVAYADLWQPSGQPAVVLAHTSVFWGASALGQLSIALAYSGTVVWTEASDATELRRCIAEERVNVLGVVPDHLDLLAPESPSCELPNIDVVFTWGERLPRRTADRWRDHPRAVLRELLIATEYWLCLWADPLCDSAFRIVRGTKVLIMDDRGGDVAVGEVGELMIAGPMVMAGYHGNVGDAPESFCTVGRECFFRTKDLVRRIPEGIIYKGRADMMTKHKGKWVDLMVIEDQVSHLAGVRAAKVLCDPVQEHFHAFVALDPSCPTGPALNRIRLSLPPRLQLWLVQELPRHAVTRKVDINKLSKLLVGLPPSWPVEGNASFADGPPELRERLSTLLLKQLCWQLVAFGTAWLVADRSDLAFQLSVLAVYLPAVAFVTRTLKESSRPMTVLVLTIMWISTAVFTQAPVLIRLARSTWSVALLTYIYLTLTYADSCRYSCFAARATMAFVDELPFWKFGAFIIFSLGQHLPGLPGAMSQTLLVTYAFVGVVLSVRRRRYVAWAIVFWSIGVGNQLGRECEAWTNPSFWWWNIRSKVLRLWSARRALFQPIVAFHQRLLRARCPDPVVAPSWPASELQCCSWCAATVATRWTARDGQDRVLCDECGATYCADAEAAAAEWLSSSACACSQKQPGDSVETMPKIRGTETVNGVVDNLDEPTCCDQSCPMTAQGSDGEKEGVTDRQWHREQLENWWWYNKTTDTFDIDSEEERRVIAALTSDVPSSMADAVHVPPEMLLLCAVIGQIEPLLKPVRRDTVLIGMDSLQIARLANTIRIQLGISLTVQQLREANTVEDLAGITSKAAAMTAEAQPSSEDLAGSDTSREYAVWYSPGQYKAMGYWVLRTDDQFDHEAMVQAAQALVDRHEALRVQIIDPLRYMSILYDAAVVFTLCAPLLGKGPAFARWLRRLISKAFTKAWPRIKCYRREELYGTRFPETFAPIEILQVHGGQVELERVLRQRRNMMDPPGVITGYELSCYLSDVWAYDNPHWKGKFVIMTAPAHLALPDDARLVYVDCTSREWGPLVGPGCSQWQVPPYGFPALFFVALCSGAVAWIRVENRDELRICYREGSSRSTWNRRLVAYRAAPQRGRDCHPPVIVNFLSVGMFHCFADGNCYLPLVQDFLMLYDAARGHAAPRLPAIPSAFEELERRLFDTFHCRPAPMRSSLRGGIFGFCGLGYGYCLGIGPGATSAVTRAAVHYRVPMDVVLLGIVVCAMARADHSDFCDFTLYAPMRDGAAEATAVGLFSDFRDLYASADFELATVLGTVLQLSHKIQHRQWTVFNALRKPERTVINIQPLDFEKRAGFKNLGENMWRDGDRLNESERRSREMGYAQQPATFVIEQQDEETWWVLAGAGHERRPAPWMRRFVEGFREALSAFLFEPLAPVHRPLPDDDTLLLTCAGVGRPVCLSAPA